MASATSRVLEFLTELNENCQLQKQRVIKQKQKYTPERLGGVSRR